MTSFQSYDLQISLNSVVQRLNPVVLERCNGFLQWSLTRHILYKDPKAHSFRRIDVLQGPVRGVVDANSFLLLHTL